MIAIVLLAVVGGGVGAWYSQRNKTEIQVIRAPLSRGDIVDTVGATGTLQAVTTVQVGSQVSGNIEWLGADFNSIVRKGQVIARLDPSLFDAQLQQVQANLVQARANLTKARIADHIGRSDASSPLWSPISRLVPVCGLVTLLGLAGSGDTG